MLNTICHRASKFRILVSYSYSELINGLLVCYFDSIKIKDRSAITHVSVIGIADQSVFQFLAVTSL